MFNKELKLEVEAIKNTVEELMGEVASLKEYYNDYLEWCKMRTANAEAAKKQGHFYISAEDTALLERFIQEINHDPDLAVLMTTAGGTTVSLRTHPHPESKSSFAHKFEGGEE